MMQDGLCHTRMQVEKHHALIHLCVDHQRLFLCGSPKGLFGIMYAKTYCCKLRVIVAFECVEVVGTLFSGTIPSPEVILKKYRHLLHHWVTAEGRGGCYLQCGNQIFFAIGSHFSDREL